MANISSGDFNGMAALWLDNGHVKLAATTDRGPRVVFWGWQDGENLFVELPDAAIPAPFGPYNLLGGHRLWYAPEVIERTYRTDDAPVKVTETAGGALFTQPDDGVGIVKSIALELAPDAPEVTVTHTLENVGVWGVQLAPWGISMCRPGGVAVLPQPREKTDPGGFLPNRRFAFWPYTDVNDQRLTLGNQMTLIRANPGPNNKVGYRNVDGWFGYWIDGTFYTKHFAPQLSGEHPDQGSNAEFFFSENVIELETLGPLVTLEPGGQVMMEETWRLSKAPTAVETEADAVELARSLGLW